MVIRQEAAVFRNPRRDPGGLLALRVYRSLKPVIAAINGPAVGVGATMTLPMDIRIMADTARVGFVFARRGIVPDVAAGRARQRGAGRQPCPQPLSCSRSGRSAPPGQSGRMSRPSRSRLNGTTAVTARAGSGP
jgi:hypothetical protein